MTPKLLDEIKQNKPFASVQEELFLNLSRTASALGHSVEQHLRPYGLSPTQYNVLRILRGAGPDGLCQADIGDRLVAQVPDVPRILDRMEKAGWVRRERGTEDRRVVLASLTEPGAAVLRELDAPLAQMMAGMFVSMTSEDMQRLNDLLVAARA